MLVEVDGYRVLTDPVLGERSSPVSFAGPRRFHDAPSSVAELPRLDAVLVSQVVTQRDVHKENARAFLDELGKLGIRDRLVAILGGPRIDHRLALELGYDAGFGPGTKPSACPRKAQDFPGPGGGRL